MSCIARLDKSWDRFSADLLPIADVFKDVFKNNRWVRFHALPHSKRYPDTNAEYKEVFRRHNTVMDDIMPDGQLRFLILSEYSDTELLNDQPHVSLDVFPDIMFWKVIPYEEGFLHLHAVQIRGETKQLNSILRFVADDEIFNVIILSETGVLFHPYDGGADIIMLSSKDKEDLKFEYKEWLSDRPDGL